MTTKRRILIVDDEPSFTRLLKLSLLTTGAYEVREENSGERALQAAREFKPDLILLDVIMPGKDGGEVAAEIANDDSLKRIPIVFLTAAVSKKEVGGEGRVIGGRSFLAKPVSVAEVTRYIEKNVSP